MSAVASNDVDTTARAMEVGGGGEGRGGEEGGVALCGGLGLGAKNVQARIRRSERDGVGV